LIQVTNPKIKNKAATISNGINVDDFFIFLILI